MCIYNQIVFVTAWGHRRLGVFWPQEPAQRLGYPNLRQKIAGAKDRWETWKHKNKHVGDAERFWRANRSKKGNPTNNYVSSVWISLFRHFYLAWSCYQVRFCKTIHANTCSTDRDYMWLNVPDHCKYRLVSSTMASWVGPERVDGKVIY